ncbi:MAG TPA: hypothetical protein VGC53_05315 [Vicinamibacteria bacterium]|jgi:hypothetical protein
MLTASGSLVEHLRSLLPPIEPPPQNARVSETEVEGLPAGDVSPTIAEHDLVRWVAAVAGILILLLAVWTTLKRWQR